MLRLPCPYISEIILSPFVIKITMTGSIKNIITVIYLTRLFFNKSILFSETHVEKCEKRTIDIDDKTTPVIISLSVPLYVNSDVVPTPIPVAICLSIISLISDVALPMISGIDKISIFFSFSLSKLFLNVSLISFLTLIVIKIASATPENKKA